MDQLFETMKAIEAQYLQPHNFKAYDNYSLPSEIVKSSKSVLSYGVHKDVRFEQAMLDENPHLDIHCFDPTPDSIRLFETNFNHKEKLKFYPIAYAKESGTAEFFYHKNDLNKCYSLLPLFGENSASIKVPTKSLVDCISDHTPFGVDIIKADIEGVWYDICKEVLDHNIEFKAFLIEFEIKLIDNEKSISQYEELLKEFKNKGYSLYLNKPRNKHISEAIILKGLDYAR